MQRSLIPYLKRWDLQADGPLQTTFHSFLLPVRRQGEQAMLKVVRKQSDEQRAGGCLTYWNGQGAVRLYDEVPGEALLLEWGSSGDHLHRMTQRGEDDGASLILAETIRDLHACPALPPPGLPTLSARFAFLASPSTPSFRFRQAASEMAAALLREDRPCLVLHGDLHHGNIVRTGRGWVAIDPKGLWGDPGYDAANALCNPIESPLTMQPDIFLRRAAIYSNHLGIPADRLLRFAFVHACLSIGWAWQDGTSDQHWRRCAETLHHLISSS